MSFEVENDALPRPLTIAIAALGGQGGGVLSGWIVKTAERSGYIAQSTSVPGVAQRTGATVYCIELYPMSVAKKAGRDPVLALMPMPGDVDIVIAAELMEAGRALTRGFVTTDRTTLIASTHREYAISEKSARGDGKADGQAVFKAIGERAKRFIAFDMKEVADEAGSIISAALFGALAGSRALPFTREAFEECIHDDARMVKANLDAFDRAYKRAVNVDDVTERQVRGPSRERASVRGISSVGQAIIERILRTFPQPCRDVIIEGARRCMDYQNARYARIYLDHLERLLESDRREKDFELTSTVARYLALWMTYEDVIRVADLKTREMRFSRVMQEMRVKPGEIVHIMEFMHPRLDEMADIMPAVLGGWLKRSRIAGALFAPFFRKGRHIPTTKLYGYLLLRGLANLRVLRPVSLRRKTEMRHIEHWLGFIGETAETDYALAVEIARCQRLIKGYGETYERGIADFESLMADARSLKGEPDAAQSLAKKRESFLKEAD